MVRIFPVLDRVFLVAVLALSSVHLSCSEEQDLQAGTGSLIDHTLWDPVPANDDYFVSPTSSEADCVAGEAYLAEVFGQDLVFSVSTGECGSLTVEQPLMVDLPAGTWVEGRLWHFALDADEPATGWVAIALEGTIVWEHVVAIPAGSGLLRIEWRAPRDMLSGESIRFHLQNHGDNSWHFIDLVVRE